jgi:hypothetical protein
LDASELGAADHHRAARGAPHQEVLESRRTRSPHSVTHEIRHRRRARQFEVRDRGEHAAKLNGRVLAIGVQLAT